MRSFLVIALLVGAAVVASVPFHDQGWECRAPVFAAASGREVPNDVLLEQVSQDHEGLFGVDPSKGVPALVHVCRGPARWRLVVSFALVVVAVVVAARGRRSARTAALR